MKELIKHYLRSAIDGYAPSGLRNCHVMGMSSIVLNDQPGNRIRVFVASWGNELRKDTLAVHAHHCDLTLIPLFGNVTHHRYSDPQGPTNDPFAFELCAYSSGITGPESKLTRTGKRFSLAETNSPLKACRLLSADLHSVSIHNGAPAAWVVIEGAEDPDYESICYSRDPGEFDPQGLYIPMSQAEIVDALTICVMGIEASSK